MSINLQGTYPLVAGYTVLAQSGITTADPLTVNKNKYGSAAGLVQVSGGTSTLDNNVTAATTQLGTLINTINTFTPNYTALPAAVSNVITITPGVYNVSGSISISFPDNITFDAGGDSSKQFFIISSSSITLSGVLNIVLAGNAQASNIFWLASTTFSMIGTSSLFFYGIVISVSSTISFDRVITVNGQLYARNANVTFGNTSTVNGFDFTSPVCFVKGTKIMTNRGFIPIEDITLNDIIITPGLINNDTIISTGLIKVPIVFIGHFTENNLTEISRPIVITKDALGINVPTENVRVSPNHAVIVNNRPNHAAGLINNNKTIYQDMECDSVTYYHIMLDDHFILNSSGLLSESLKGCTKQFTEYIPKDFKSRNN